MARALVLIVVAAALLALPQQAGSRVAANTVESTARLWKQDRRADVGVLLACDRTQRARLRVTVTQRSGSFARGARRARCTTVLGRFAVRTVVRRRPALAPGQATVCVVALTRDDALQWCKAVTLR